MILVPTVSFQEMSSDRLAAIEPQEVVCALFSHDSARRTRRPSNGVWFVSLRVHQKLTTLNWRGYPSWLEPSLNCMIYQGAFNFAGNSESCILHLRHSRWWKVSCVVCDNAVCIGEFECRICVRMRVQVGAHGCSTTGVENIAYQKWLRFEWLNVLHRIASKKLFKSMLQRIASCCKSCHYNSGAVRPARTVALNLFLAIFMM